MDKRLTAKHLLTYVDTVAEALFSEVTYPWEVLTDIGAYIKHLIGTKDKRDYEQHAADVFIHKSVVMAPTALICGPAWIEADAEIRHGAFIRGNALICSGAVIGNSTEIKNAVLLEGCQVPHYNYVGDAVLGKNAHLGAGVIVSNLKSDGKPVVVRTDHESIETGLRKFGAIVADFADVGCNSVLNPGSILGRRCRVYPLSFVRGFVPDETIYKKQGEIVTLRRD